MQGAYAGPLECWFVEFHIPSPNVIRHQGGLWDHVFPSPSPSFDARLWDSGSVGHPRLHFLSPCVPDFLRKAGATDAKPYGFGHRMPTLRKLREEWGTHSAMVVGDIKSYRDSGSVGNPALMPAEARNAADRLPGLIEYAIDQTMDSLERVCFDSRISEVNVVNPGSPLPRNRRKKRAKDDQSNS
jgi:hypothetical protein